MGCWNHTCAITNLPVFYQEPVYAFLLQGNKHSSICHPDAFWSMLPLHFTGTYDDYGRVENCEGEMIPHLLHYLKSCLVEMELGENEHRDMAVKRDELDLKKVFEANHTDRLFVKDFMGNQSQVSHIVIKKNVLESLFKLWKPYDRSISFNETVEAGKKFYRDMKSKVAGEEAMSWRHYSFMHDLGDGERGPFSPVLGSLSQRMANGPLRNINQAIATQDDELLDVVAYQLTVWYWLDSWCDQARRVWVPPSGAGSQDAETTAQEVISMITLAEAKVIQHRWDEV